MAQSGYFGPISFEELLRYLELFLTTRGQPHSTLEWLKSGAFLRPGAKVLIFIPGQEDQVSAQRDQDLQLSI